jgi:hypothetical protein
MVTEWIRKRLQPYGGHLRFKLDWFFGRNVFPLSNRERRDPETGLESSAPDCLPSPMVGQDRVSDHAPIFADLVL